jgi:hypothetical protein
MECTNTHGGIAMPKSVGRTVLVVIAGSRAEGPAGETQTRDEQVEILQETTARDVLRKVKVTNGVLKKPSEGFTFGDNEKIYDRVETGEKLHAVPRTPVAS